MEGAIVLEEEAEWLANSLDPTCGRIHIGVVQIGDGLAEFSSVSIHKPTI
jgi:hypothetical protein